MGRLLKGIPLSFVNPKQTVWVRTTAGDFSCTAETEINSSEVTIVVQDNGKAHAFCESSPKESYRAIVRKQRGYLRVLEEAENGVAVLYSVVAGDLREFWLKTVRLDVKVHEIPKDFGETDGGGGGEDPGSGGSVSEDASYVIAYSTDFGVQYDAYRGPLEGFRIAPYTPSGDLVTPRPQLLCHGYLSRGTNSNCATVLRIEDGPAWFALTNTTATQIISAKKCPEGIDVDPADIPGAVDNGGYVPPEVVPNFYEAFVSGLNSKIFTLIKSGEDSSAFDELAYKQIVGRSVSDLGSTASPNDWRGLAISLTPTAGITSEDSCLENYLDSEDGALVNGNLYRIDLAQDIDGHTLRNLLQSSPGDVLATLTTQPASSGDTCSLGIVKESKVKVPSPGRGTVEGITYRP